MAEDHNESLTSPPSAAAAAGPPAAPFGLIFRAPDPIVESPPPRTSADGQDEDEDDDTGSRKRRRGGRGRRGRGGSDTSDPSNSDSGRHEQGTKPARSEEPGSRRAKSAARADIPAEDSESTARAGESAPGDSPKTSENGSIGAATDADPSADADPVNQDGDAAGGDGNVRRRRRRRRSTTDSDSGDPPGTVTKVRVPRKDRDEPTALAGSTRLEAKKQRRREGRGSSRRRTVITEAEFLARRESVERTMVVRGTDDKTQIGVLEDGILVEHYVSRASQAPMVGNVYLGRVQNVLPSMEAAFVDIGRGRNAVLYAGEVNWDAAGLEQNQPKRIESALTSGDTVLVQVTKDPIGHKGARLTSQISLPGRYLVYVPEGSMTGISRKLPDTERSRLKSILSSVMPEGAGVIVRTAAEGASEEELVADVARLTKIWEGIQKRSESLAKKKTGSGGAPVLVHGEADMTVRVIRDVFTEDFAALTVSGERAWSEVSSYVADVAPDLATRLTKWTSSTDIFSEHRIDEQIAKAMDRKVWLPSGGSLVIDRTEAMTVVDVNTGKFVGSGGNLEQTVTANNIEAAEEIVRQLRLRDIGGIIVIDFIDMVLESNRELVTRRLMECLGRDRTKHQVAEVTSLGLVQMTRKRVGSGLIEVFSEPCEHCDGRGIIVHAEPIDHPESASTTVTESHDSRRSGKRAGKNHTGSAARSSRQTASSPSTEPSPSGPSAAQIAAAAHAAAVRSMSGDLGGTKAAAGSDDAAEPSGAHTSETSSAAHSATSANEISSASAPPADADLSAPTQFTSTPPAALPDDAATAEPAPARSRRKRGRVVAPAGPPVGSAAVEIVGVADSQTAAASANGPIDLASADADQ